MRLGFTVYLDTDTGKLTVHGETPSARVITGICTATPLRNGERIPPMDLVLRLRLAFESYFRQWDEHDAEMSRDILEKEGF